MDSRSFESFPPEVQKYVWEGEVIKTLSHPIKGKVDLSNSKNLNFLFKASCIVIDNIIYNNADIWVDCPLIITDYVGDNVTITSNHDIIFKEQVGKKLTINSGEEDHCPEWFDFISRGEIFQRDYTKQIVFFKPNKNHPTITSKGNIYEVPDDTGRTFYVESPFLKKQLYDAANLRKSIYEKPISCLFKPSVKKKLKITEEDFINSAFGKGTNVARQLRLNRE